MAKSPPKKGRVKGPKGAAKTSSQRAKPRKRAAATKAVAPVANAQPARGESRDVVRLLRTSRSSRSMLRFWAKWLAIVLAVAIAIPVFLTILYWPSGVRPVSTLMLAERVSGQKVRRDWVSFDDIAPVAWQSVMMSEDGRFCAHGGVDWDQVNLVLDDVLEGEKVRGASTISMQTVKNLYLWSSRSYVRKVLEVPLAMLVDFVWGKKRVMEIYLNVAEWGPGIYGIEAAAQHHFKRSAKRLSRKQAAMLAVTLPNPKLRNPRKPSRGMKRLARLIERRAKASGAYIGCLR